MTTYDTADRRTGGQSFSIASIVAIIAAIASFVIDSPFWTIFLAISAVIAGLIGVVLALSPNVRGGIVSTVALLLGLLAAAIGLFTGIGRLFTGDDDDVRTTPVVVDDPAPALVDPTPTVVD